MNIMTRRIELQKGFTGYQLHVIACTANEHLIEKPYIQQTFKDIVETGTITVYKIGRQGVLKEIK